MFGLVREVIAWVNFPGKFFFHLSMLSLTTQVKCWLALLHICSESRKLYTWL